jgi:hypothetical protein
VACAANHTCRARPAPRVSDAPARPVGHERTIRGCERIPSDEERWHRDPRGPALTPDDVARGRRGVRGVLVWRSGARLRLGCRLGSASRDCPLSVQRSKQLEKALPLLNAQRQHPLPVDAVPEQRRLRAAHLQARLQASSHRPRESDQTETCASWPDVAEGPADRVPAEPVLPGHAHDDDLQPGLRHGRVQAGSERLAQLLTAAPYSRQRPSSQKLHRNFSFA